MRGKMRLSRRVSEARPTYRTLIGLESRLGDAIEILLSCTMRSAGSYRPVWYHLFRTNTGWNTLRAIGSVLTLSNGGFWTFKFFWSGCVDIRS